MLQIVISAGRGWSNHKDARQGAALAYYSVFSLGPILIIAIAIAGFFFGQEAVRGQVGDSLRELLGNSGAQAIETMLQSAGKPKEGLLAGGLALGALLFAAIGVVVQLKDALNTVWEVEPSKESGAWPFLRSYVFSLAGVVAVGFLLLVSLFMTAVLGAAGKYLSGSVPDWALQGLNLVVSFCVIATMFAMMFKWLPDTAVEWREVWLGAALTALLFELGKSVIGIYIGKQGLESTFGAAASIVVVLIWVYYTSQIVLLGAEFTKAHAESNRPPKSATSLSGKAEDTHMATDNSDRSMSLLELEAEQKRAELARTVDQIQTRVSAKAIKENVNTYIQEKKNGIYDQAVRTIRENPLRAVAIGAGIAYPFWRLAAAMPAPVLLIGAGIALSSKGSVASISSNAAVFKARDAAASTASGVGDTVQEVAASAQRKMHDLRDQGSEQAAKLSNAATAALSPAAEAIKGAVSRSGDLIDEAKQQITRAYAVASDVAANSVAGAREISKDVADQVGDSAKAARTAVVESFEKHPAVIGGVGLFIGALIAAAIPMTRAEGRLAGRASDTLKARMRDTVNDGVEAAQSHASQLVDDVVDLASKEGLSPELISKAGDKVSESVKKAADQIGNVGSAADAKFPNIQSQTGGHHD